MQLLVVVTPRTDPDVAAAVLAERFGAGPLRIDLVTALPGRSGAIEPDKDCGKISRELLRRQARQAIAAPAEALADRLRGLPSVHAVTTHVEFGDTAATIARRAASLDSDLVMLEAGADSLLERLNPANLAGQLLQRAPCAVELTKPFAALPRSQFTVLVTLDIDAIDRFPLMQLAALPWPRATALHLSGLVTVPEDTAVIEAPAYRVMHDLSMRSASKARARARLDAACGELAGALGRGCTLDCSVTTSTRTEAIIERALRLRASLIVTSLPAITAPEFPASRLVAWAARAGRDTALALRSPCSVLVLRDRGPSDAPQALVHDRG